MLANPTLVGLTGVSEEEKERDVWERTKRINKTEFALKYAIDETNWSVPRYIAEGLRWLREESQQQAMTILEDMLPVPLADGETESESQPDA
jgi:hypothetical protein